LVGEPANVLFPLVHLHLLPPHDARALLHQKMGACEHQGCALEGHALHLVPSNERPHLRAARAKGTSTAACDGGAGQQDSRTAGQQLPLLRPAWACSRATRSTTACGDRAAKSPTEPLGSPPTAFQTCGPGPRWSATQTFRGRKGLLAAAGPSGRCRQSGLKAEFNELKKKKR